MGTGEDDPWTRWYAAYRVQRAALKAAREVAAERRRAANVAALFLVGYMLVGGALASVAVGVVMAN